LKLLLADPRVDPSVQNNQLIINAAQTGKSKIAKLLLADPRVNPADQNNQAIIKAAIWSHMEIVKLLLEDERIDQSIRHDPILLETFSVHEMHRFFRRLEDICKILEKR
jgi:hypothetical protein